MQRITVEAGTSTSPGAVMASSNNKRVGSSMKLGRRSMQGWQIGKADL
jgi:hypothetical protein